MASTPQIWDIEWLNENSQRKYPLSEGSSLRDSSGSITIPNDFLVDMIVPIHYDPTVDPLKVHILTLSVFSGGVTVTLGYNGTAIGSVTIDASTFVRNNTYFIQCTGLFFDTVAKIVVGSLTSIMKLGGSYSFLLADARLEPTVVKPDIRGVTAITLKNGDDVSAPIQNDVVFQAGRNMLMTFIAGTGTLADPSRILFNAIDGQGLNADCECNEATTLPCVKTINGIDPDENGRFNLLESDCLKLQEIANGLKLADTCATPCCGCQELDVVTQTLERVQTQVNSLENLASRLEGAINVMEFAIAQTQAFRIA
jgi:hypothetical protein